MRNPKFRDDNKWLPSSEELSQDFQKKSGPWTQLFWDKYILFSFHHVRFLRRSTSWASIKKKWSRDYLVWGIVKKTHSDLLERCDIFRLILVNGFSWWRAKLLSWSVTWESKVLRNFLGNGMMTSVHCTQNSLLQESHNDTNICAAWCVLTSYSKWRGTHFKNTF